MLLDEKKTQDFINELKEILDTSLPKNFIKQVVKYNGSFGARYIKVAFMPTDYEINNVRGQYPLLSSFSIDLETLELDTQVYGGSGGRRLYFNINPEDPKEKFYALHGVNVPFRRPQRNTGAIKRALIKYCENYLKTIKKVSLQGAYRLRYADKIDYSFLDSVKI